ncbi:MAG: GAF domain-containing sensor histidine kinase [Gemmatimonadaceae bacterium]|nr:GAF domain-containing sensor histidine kinase [Gemmatimonadaceae bacterium]
MPETQRSRRPSMQARLRQLDVATSALITDDSLDAVLTRTVQVAAQVLGARYAAIGVVGPDGKVLESFTTHGIAPGLERRIGAPPSGHGMLGVVVREAKPVRLRDLTAHRESCGFPAHHPSMHSFLGVPIVGRRGVLGSIYVTEKRAGRQFTDQDEDLAILLAAKVAAAIENARHHQESARLLEEVQQLQRARERFFAMVNHELRNALAAVYGWSEMLIRKRDPATVPRAAFEVLGSAEDAIHLINDLLDLSRLDEDRLKPVIRVVESCSMAKRAMTRVTPAASMKEIILELAPAADLPSCSTDSSRVEQILINLLGNAIKFAPPRSTVRISIASHNARVLYEVKDQGAGISPTELERIFDVYVTKAGEESRGLGLGLPLSRRLARLLGGELRAISQPGKGGWFILEVPANAS